MAKLFVLCILFVAITVARGTTDSECSKPNEERRCVAQCPPQKTCRTKDIQVSCLQSATENCTDQCVCKEGYFRNLAGDCVTSDDCDQCTSQNQYYTCRVEPDEQCKDIKSTDCPDSSQPDVADNAGSQQDTSNDNAVNGTDCKAQCYCAPGTARDENSQCVPYDQCNKPCGPDEVKNYCPADCPVDNCPKSESEPTQCAQPSPCPPPKCKCRFNFRRAENGTCIPTRECPPFECKKPHEEYNPCPPWCPNGSCSQATPTGRCPAIFGRIGIVLQCFPKCRCEKGYWWDENKVCIPYEQCPGKGNSTTTITPK